MQMVKVTWLGEDTEEMPGPSYNVWNGIKFPKGTAVEVTDAYMIGKARTNQFFKVTEEETIMEAKNETETQVEGEGKLTAQAEVVSAQKAAERKTEKGTGYSPVEKKPGKKKTAPADPGTATDA
jgi:hypothetical protein